MKLGYTIIYVESVQSSLAFYERAFGLKTRFLHESNEYGELETGDTALAFASHAMGDMNFGENHYQKAQRDTLPLGIEIALVTDDVDAAFAKAIAAGAQIVSEPEQKPWGQTVAYVRDDSGVLVELCSSIGA